MVFEQQERKKKRCRVNVAGKKSAYFRECFARTVEIRGETVVIDKRLDIIAAKQKRKVKPWIAEWVGTTVIEYGDTFDEAVAAITERIRRKQGMAEIKKIMHERMIKRALQEVVDGIKRKEPGI